MYKIPNLLFADKKGQIYDHPTLKMCCKTNIFNIVPYESELEELPKYSKIKFIENAKPYAYDQESAKIIEFDGGYPIYVVPPKGYLRVSLPAFLKTKDSKPINEACTAVGFMDEKFYFSAIKIDILTSDITQAKSFKDILSTYSGSNNLIRHFAKMSRSIYKDIENLTPLGNELILDTYYLENNSVQEISEMINFLNNSQKDLVITFANLTQDKIIQKVCDCIKEIKKNDNITINIEPYQINIDTIKSILNSEIDLVTLNISSLNNSIAHNILGFHQEYETYFKNAQKLIDISKTYNFEIILNLNILPGFTDIRPNVQSLIDFITTYNLNFLKLSNMAIDSDIFFKSGTILEEEILGVKNMLKELKKKCKSIKFGAFTRSKKYLYKDTGLPDLKRRKR
jgi:hypothetical protein